MQTAISLWRLASSVGYILWNETLHKRSEKFEFMSVRKQHYYITVTTYVSWVWVQLIIFSINVLHLWARPQDNKNVIHNSLFAFIFP
jgi:hypothetical protein